MHDRMGRWHNNDVCVKRLLHECYWSKNSDFSHGCLEIRSPFFGVDVEVSTYNGLRPLHRAAANDHISIVKELIEERNTEINARNDNGDTALRLARQFDKPDVASYLVSHSGIE